MGQCMGKGASGTVASKGAAPAPLHTGQDATVPHPRPKHTPVKESPKESCESRPAGALPASSSADVHRPSPPSSPAPATSEPLPPPPQTWTAPEAQPTESTVRATANAASLSNRLAQGSTHVWLLASWKNPHLQASPLLPLDSPYLGRRAAAATASGATKVTPVPKKNGATAALHSRGSHSQTNGSVGMAVSEVSSTATGVTPTATLPPASFASLLAPDTFGGFVVVGAERIRGITRGALFVRRPGELVGEEMTLAACDSVSFVLMTQLSKVVVEDCRRCFFFIGPTTTSVSFTRCVDCVVVVLASRLLFTECHSMLCSAHTTSLPLLTNAHDIYMSAFSAWFTYNELPLHLRAAGLSPFINNYSTVLDRTPPSLSRSGPSAGKTCDGAAGGAKTAKTHARNYRCITDFALDLLLYEWWVRVEDAKHVQAARPIAAAATTTTTTTTAEKDKEDEETEREGTQTCDVLAGDVQAAYTFAREQWKAELDAFRPPRAVHEAGLLRGSIAGVADLSDVDVTGEPTPLPEVPASEEKAATKEMVNADASRRPSGRRLNAVRAIYPSAFMTADELKLRGYFLTAPVVFLSSVVATASSPSPLPATTADSDKASESGATNVKALIGPVAPDTPTTDELYFRLRTLLRQRDARVSALQPPYAPRSLADVRLLFEHAVLVPATLGAQPIPTDCLRQHWRLKLFVVTAKGGGWTIAKRVLSDVERYRRMALVASVESSSSSSATGPTDLTKCAVDDVTKRHGPVLLLNTAELRCSDVIMREYVAPTFYLLTEPVEAARARHAQKQQQQQQQQQQTTKHGKAGQAQAKRAVPLSDNKDDNDRRSLSSSSSSEGHDNMAGNATGGFFERAKRMVQRQIGGHKGDRGETDHDRDGDAGDLRDDQVQSACDDNEGVQSREKDDARAPRAPAKAANNPAAAHGRTSTTATSAEAAATAESVSRHLVAMRRLFGEAIQRMSGQTCVLLLALVAPTPLTAATDLRAIHARDGAPGMSASVAMTSAATSTSAVVPVALPHGLPADPADVFQPLTHAREQVLQLANDHFERQQSILQPLLPVATPASGAGAARRDSLPSGRVLRTQKENDKDNKDEEEEEEEDGQATDLDDAFASCIELPLFSTTTQRRTHQRDSLASTTTAGAGVPESCVPRARLCNGESGISGEGTSAPPPPPSPPSAPSRRPMRALPLHPVSAVVSAEERVWTQSVILNVSLPIRFVSVLQANIFLKGCVSSHQIASAGATVEAPPPKADQGSA